jgi:tellurite methyltransferase
MVEERQRWDRRYRDSGKDQREADVFFTWAYETFVAPAFPIPGRALDLAGGLGRHAMWLAQRGWSTSLVDISEVAIEKAKAQARKLSKQIEFHNQNAAQFLATDQQYDLVLVFYFLDRNLFSAIAEVVRPGGFLLYKTFTTAQRRVSQGPTDPSHLLKPGELRGAFPSLRLLHYSEIVAQGATAELVARK